MENISLFKHFIKGIGTRTLSEILSGIRGAHYKEVVYRIRKAVEDREKEEEKEKKMKETKEKMKETKEKEVNKEVDRLNKKVDRLKKSLLGFTVSGEFLGGRKMAFLQKYNPFVILDIDKVDVAVLPDLIKRINEISFTRMSFISPSGRGVKIIVKVDSEMERHWLAYNEVAGFYESELGVEIDRSGKDITRLCFMSHDPSAYFDPNSEVFEVSKEEEGVLDSMLEKELDLVPGVVSSFENGAMNLDVDMNGAFAECVAITNQKLEFKKGNRNNYIYQLAVTCSSAGIPLEVTDRLSKGAFDLSEEEIEQTVRSAYNWKPRGSKVTKTSVELPNYTPPAIPVKVFSKLPNLLRDGCAYFKDERERDVFLTGALGVLSGCMYSVKGVYDGHVSYPNLYVFVIAPSASGKGALKFAKMLGMAHHQKLLKESKEAFEEYKKALLKFEFAAAQYKRGKLSELPEEPKEVAFKTLFIPANSSSAMLVRHLGNNDDSGILFESEADTLGNVLKQDWGGYSDLMRKAYHHEPISYSRKHNNEFVEIAEPKLSVTLSGTPGQVTGLIPSAEDGLFSRFLFYAFEVEATWRDVSPAGRPTNFQSRFEDLSQEVLKMVAFLKEHPMKFDLEKKQWEVLNRIYSDLTEETKSLYGKDALGIVKRSAFMLFRLAMIFAAIRKYEEQDTSKLIICKDNDFDAALELMGTYVAHAFFMFDRLPKRSKGAFQFKNDRQQIFYDNLPFSFSKKEAVKVGQGFKIPARTVGRYLNELIKLGFLINDPDQQHGRYMKSQEG